MYLGIPIGFLILTTITKMDLFMAMSIAIPLVIDGIFQEIGVWTSNNPRRFTTGLLFGIGIGIILRYFYKILHL